MRILDKGPNRPYTIVLTTDFDILQDEVQKAVKPSNILIITDNNVEKHYLTTIKDILSKIAPVVTHSFVPGEGSKTLDTVTAIYDTLIDNHFDRSSMIVALGGGVVGDIAGFAASSYMRGIPFIQIPTTVIAQNDSSIGGKVGVDYHGHKNMIGAFYQPKLVYINMSTLETLDPREYIAGLAEVIKHGLIKDKNFYEYLKTNKDKILLKDKECLIEMTYRSCQIKAEVVEQDVNELGIRKILNFGHTIGHAIETLSLFSLLHGECVGYGMCAVGYICYMRKLISQSELEDIVELCKAYGLLKPLASYEENEILNQIQYDKKKLYGKISFVLLNKIGEASIWTDITEDEIIQSILFTKETCK